MYFDGVANRTYWELDDGSPTTDIYDYATGTNRVSEIDRNSSSYRAFTYDDAGNIATDTLGGTTTTYTYNHAGRMASLTVGASGRGPYVYNGFGQLTLRQVTAGVSASGIHMLYDRDGNLIAGRTVMPSAGSA